MYSFEFLNIIFWENFDRNRDGQKEIESADLAFMAGT